MLDKYKILNFSQLVRLLQENKVIKNRTAISEHLKYLTDKKILQWEKQWEKNSIGKPSSITFTTDAQIQRKYGIFKVDYDKRGICKEWREQMNENEEEKRERMLVLYLLLAMAYGFDKKNLRNQLNSEYYVEKGISPYDLQQESVFLTLFNMDIKKFDDSKHKMFEKLLDTNDKDIPIKKILGNDGIIRYDIEDNGLKKLLVWSGQVLFYYVGLMIRCWYITSKEPKKKEREQRFWYRKLVGKEAATELFSLIEQNKHEGKSIKELYVQVYFPYHPKEKAYEIINCCEEYYKDYYTKEEIEKRIFSSEPGKCPDISGFGPDLRLIHEYCRDIQNDEEIQKTIKSKKYDWLIKILEEVVNPQFSRKHFQLFKMKTSI